MNGGWESSWLQIPEEGKMWNDYAEVKKSEWLFKAVITQVGDENGTRIFRVQNTRRRQVIVLKNGNIQGKVYDVTFEETGGTVRLPWQVRVR